MALLSLSLSLCVYTQVVGNNIHFGKIVEHRQAKASDVPTMRLIAESLSYATELERIV